MSDRQAEIARFLDPERIDTLTVDTRSLGQSGLRHAGGFIQEETLSQLEGQRGMRAFADMADNDDVCNAIVFAIQQLTRSATFTVTPASQRPYDRQAADHVEQCMNDMDQTWTDTICEMMSMPIYGFSLHEMVYKIRLGRDQRKTHRSRYNDGRVGWRGLFIRSQDSILRWGFDINGDILGVEQQCYTGAPSVAIPIENLLHLRTVSYKNNPYGRSIFRGAYESYVYKRRFRRLEGIGHERDLTGIPHMGVPAELLRTDAADDEKALAAYIAKMLKNIRMGEQASVLWPLAYDEDGNKMYEFGLLQGGGPKQMDVDKTIQRYDHRISLAAMADFMLLGASGSTSVGSNAMHSDKTDIFVQSVRGFLDIICAEVNRKAIPALIDQNTFRISDYPRIQHAGLSKVSMKDLGDYLQKIAMTGVQLFPNPELERVILETADLPAPVDSPTLAGDVADEPEPRNIPQNVVHIHPGENQQAPDPTSDISAAKPPQPIEARQAVRPTTTR